MEGQPQAPTAAGSFLKTPFPHLIVYALERRLSGTFELTLADASVATMLVLGGCPAKVRTPEDAHPLVRVLSDLGTLTPEQAQAANERIAAEPERPQTEILVELGVDAAQLEVALRTQLELRAEDLFNLSNETSFAYYDGVDLLRGMSGPSTPIDPFPIMWRGVRNTPPWEQVDATLQRISAAPLRPSAIAQFERFTFGSSELRVIEKLRQGPLRVLDITGILGPGLGQVLVYLLTIMRQLELAEAPAAAPAPSPPTPAAVPIPPSSSNVSRSPMSAVAPPSSGQNLARVQLQRQAARPLIVEEQVARSQVHDSRASHPSMPPFVIPKSEPVIEAPASPAADAAPPPAPEPPPPPPPPAAAAPAAAAPNPAHEALRQKIIERAEEINTQDYFQMLGVARDAKTEDIAKAFIALAKVWHPDRLPAALADVKDACSKIFTHLTEANATLTDQAKRQDYMTLLKDGGATPDDQAKIQQIIEAATEFQKADILLKRNPTDPQAYEIVKRCVELDDHQTDYLATLAWLEAHRPENQSAPKTLEKITILDRCIERAPNSERAIFYRAMLHKRTNDAAKALRDFKRAAELNPRNLDAVREVRLHNMRSGGPSAGAAAPKPPPSDKGASGLFGKLFKK